MELFDNLSVSLFTNYVNCFLKKPLCLLQLIHNTLRVFYQILVYNEFSNYYFEFRNLWRSL